MKLRSFSLLITTVFCGFVSEGFSQVNAGADQNICAPNCATLTATFTPVNQTSSYAVSSIPYAPDPFNAGTALVWQSNSDDEVHGPFPIGFNFCFFGFTRTDFYIGTNGWVGFSNGPTTFTSATIPSMAGTVPKDCIMGPWQDWYPAPTGGTIRYQLYGTAPFRRLVVSWNNCGLFNCLSQVGTFQIILYETTNIVETHIQQKPGPCAWAGGTAVHGVHNLFGTVAYTVPGRNSTQWTAFNDAWRFTPSGPPAYSFAWYQGMTQISTSTSISVCPTTTTAYTAQITYTCDNSTYTDLVNVNVGGSLASAGPDVSVCTNQSTTLNASGGVSYSWSPATGLSCTNCPSPVANPTSSTTYTVTVTDANGCTGTDVVNVTVTPLPTVTSSGNASICTGSSTALTASGATSYTWSPASGLSSTTVSNPVASPTATTTYTVTGSSGNGCTGTTTLTVTVFPVPTTAAIASTNPICPGGNSTLTASGGGAYSWSPSSSLSSSTISNPVATPTSTTTYTVTVTDVNGCTATATVTVNVNAPVATASANNSQICNGGNTSLNATGGGTYSWAPSSSLSNSTISNPVATPTSTTTYTVTVTDLNGCTATAVVTVTVNSLPNTSATASPAAYCLGGNSQLNAAGGVTYSWNPATSLSSTTISNPVANPTTTTTYTVTITDANGCSGTVTVTVTVNAATATATAAPGTICAGNTSSLSTGGNGVTYLWSPSSSLSASTISNPTASPTVTTTYTVTVTDVNGCTATATATVTVNSLPVVNVTANPAAICQGSSSSLQASGGASYSWSPSTGLSATNISNPSASPASTTTYTVVVTSQNGCTATGTVTVTVNQAFVLAAASATPDTCGDNNGTATAGSSTGGNPPFTYLWSNGQTGQTATGLLPGNYTVVVTDANGCTSSQVASVNQVIGVSAAASANPPSGVMPLPVNFLNGSTGGTNYIWDFGDGSPVSNSVNPSHIYNAAGVYTVMLIVYNNNPSCADTVYLTVVVNQEVSVIMPNVFTPNGDSQNDLLTAAIEGLKSASVVLYNRWGAEMASWDPIAGAWDGKGKGGSVVSDGTYFYVLTGTAFDDTPYELKGYISVIKN